MFFFQSKRVFLILHWCLTCRSRPRHDSALKELLLRLSGPVGRSSPSCWHRWWEIPRQLRVSSHGGHEWPGHERLTSEAVYSCGRRPADPPATSTNNQDRIWSRENLTDSAVIHLIKKGEKFSFILFRENRKWYVSFKIKVCESSQKQMFAPDIKNGGLCL